MKESQKQFSRRSFIEKTALVGAAGLVSPALSFNSKAMATPSMTHSDISIAQWALLPEIMGWWKDPDPGSKKWTTLDFPRIAREDFDINGIEFVNTLFASPTMGYLNQLKKNADGHGVTMVLIMVDDEGDPCDPSPKAREQFVTNHRKWIEIAQFLGCTSIRTNCRSRDTVDRKEALNWGADSYNELLEYAIPAGISVSIENHGGISNDADWMVDLYKKVDNLYFGSYPDWRGPSDNFDNVEYLEKVLPWAIGMSYRNQPTEELTAKMIKMCHDSGYRGWYGIESTGREAIHKGKKLLKKYLKI